MALFKYISSDNLKPLENRLFRFTQPSEFNDPFDVNPHISGIFGSKDIVKLIHENRDDKELDNVFQDRPLYLKLIPKNWLKKIFFKLINLYPEEINERVKEKANALAAPLAQVAFPSQIDKHIGIFCLSKNPESLLMWSHYGNSHKGVLIEFDDNHSFFHQKEFETENKDLDSLYGRVFPVLYRRNRPNIEFLEKDLSEIIFTKSIDWSYEEEHRMIMPLKKANQIIKKNIFLFEVPSDAIKAIYFGVKFDKDKITPIIQSVKEYNANTIFFQAILHNQKYDIEYEIIKS
jgi:hypothetical protein